MREAAVFRLRQLHDHLPDRSFLQWRACFANRMFTGAPQASTMLAITGSNERHAIKHNTQHPADFLLRTPEPPRAAPCRGTTAGVPAAVFGRRKISFHLSHLSHMACVKDGHTGTNFFYNAHLRCVMSDDGDAETLVDRL